MQRLLRPVLARLLRRFVVSVSGDPKESGSNFNDNFNANFKDNASSSVLVDLWHGEASLTQIELRTDAIESLLADIVDKQGVFFSRSSSAGNQSSSKEPSLLQVARATARHIRVAIPWSNLYGAPVTVHLVGVEVVLQRRECAPGAANSSSSSSSSKIPFSSASPNRASADDQQQSDDSESDRRDKSQSSSASTSGGGGLGSGIAGYFVDVDALKRNILYNLAVTVEDLIIRYDDATNPHGCAAVVCKQVSVQTSSPGTFETYTTLPNSYDDSSTSSDDESHMDRMLGRSTSVPPAPSLPTSPGSSDFVAGGGTPGVFATTAAQHGRQGSVISGRRRRSGEGSDPAGKTRVPVFVDPGPAKLVCKQVLIDGLEVRLGAPATCGATSFPPHDGLETLLLLRPCRVEGRVRIWQNRSAAALNDSGNECNRVPLNRVDFRSGDLDIRCSPAQLDALKKFLQFIQRRLAKQDVAVGESELAPSTIGAPTLGRPSFLAAGDNAFANSNPAADTTQSTPGSKKNSSSGGWLGWVWQALTEDDEQENDGALTGNTSNTNSSGYAGPVLGLDGFDALVFSGGRPAPGSSAGALQSTPETVTKHIHIGCFVSSARVMLTPSDSRLSPTTLDLGQLAVDFCQRIDPARSPATACTRSSGISAAVYTKSSFVWGHEQARHATPQADAAQVKSGAINSDASPWRDIPGFLFGVDIDSVPTNAENGDGSLYEADDLETSLHERLQLLDEENNELRLLHIKAQAEVEQLRHAMVVTGNPELTAAAEASRLRQRVFDLQLELQRAREQLQERMSQHISER